MWACMVVGLQRRIGSVLVRVWMHLCFGSAALSSWLLILSDCCWLLAGAQEYLKLLDMYKMYGSCSGDHHDGSKPTSHGHLFAIDAALAGACEVPSLPVLSLCWLVLACIHFLSSLPPCPSFSCHAAPSAGLQFIQLTALLALLCTTWASGVSSLCSASQ